LGAKGLVPDMAMAQTWYERARELGSIEAQRRLDVLASRSK
jgi:TPR repeat protein